jgi:glycosyltransferase involved in cell wall biosynthesis
MPPPEVAVVVTTYQRPWHLRRVLESIALQAASRPLEVIVTDDGSADETAQVVAQFAAEAPFPVQWVTHPHAGFHPSRCRNEGARRASAPLLLFLDGDCVLPPGHLEAHLEAWQPGWLTFAYCVRLTREQTQHVSLEAVRGGQIAGWLTRPQRRYLSWQHAKAEVHRWLGHPHKPAVRGGNFLVSRDDYQRVNGFDESFQGWGGEDDDFGQRLRAAGVRPKSITNRTCTWHLWHPKVPSFPRSWKEGVNVPYLLRSCRLTRCLRGLVRRTPRELIVRLSGTPPRSETLAWFLQAHDWQLAPPGTERADLELVCWPGGGRFHQPADCRIAVVLDVAQAQRVDYRGAHVVLSPQGDLGLRGQARLRLDDAAGLWAWLGGSDPARARMAA